MLRALFDLCSRKEQPKPWAEGDPLRTDRILNYVWVQSAPSNPQRSGVLCSVPLQYIDNAHANARKYPDTEVRIWVDYGFLDDQSRFFVESHHYLNAPSNVRLMNLRDIKRFDENDDLNVWSHARIWQRTDLTRFIVLDHVLQTTKADKVFYADFDVEDVQLDNPRTLRLLNKRGYAYARLPEADEPTLAHGYIAVARQKAEELNKVILPALERRVSFGMTVFASLNKMHCGTWDPWGVYTRAITTNVPVHPVGYEMPISPVYRNEGICGSKFRPTF